MPRRKVPRPPSQPTAKYDAGGTGRRIAGWRPPSTGPQRAVEGLTRIRDRARDAARNDWSAFTASQKWVTTLIGVGIRPRFKRIPEGPRRQALVDLWEDWTRVADADGVLDFYGMQALAVRSWFDSGEVFLRMRPRLVDAPLPVPLQVQLIEGDFVPVFDADQWQGMPEGNRIRQGIEINKYGRRTAYWMHKEHPGDGKAMVTPDMLVRVPAAQVRHVYEPKRPGQMRGVSELSAVLVRLRMAGDMEDAVLDRQRLANLYVAWVTKAMPQDWEDIDIDDATGLPKWYDTDGRAVAAMSPGTTQELAPGEGVTFSNPPEAGISHPDYMRTVHMGTASAGGMPYELLSGDIRNVSDRTLRVLILEFRRLARQRQWHMVIPMMCQPVAEAFVAAGALVGKISLAEVEMARRVEWSPEGFEHIHPMQDPQGKILEVEAGLRSRASVISERGDDPATVDAERAEDAKRSEGLGLDTPPTDPAQQQQQEQQQQALMQMVEVLAAIQKQGPEAEGRFIDAMRAFEARAAAQPPAPAPVFNLTVPPTSVNVEPTTINLPAPITNVAAAEVIVPTPVVNVTNEVHPAEVSVDVNLPERETTSVIDRDATGNIVNVVQTERTIN